MMVGVDLLRGLSVHPEECGCMAHLKIVAEQLSSYNPGSQKKQGNQIWAGEEGWSVRQVKQARPY